VTLSAQYGTLNFTTGSIDALYGQEMEGLVYTPPALGTPSNDGDGNGSFESLLFYRPDGTSSYVCLLQLADVIVGTYDGYITAWATDAKNWGHPFFLRELARSAMDGLLDPVRVPTAARDLVHQRLQGYPCA